MTAQLYSHSNTWGVIRGELMKIRMLPGILTRRMTGVFRIAVSAEDHELYCICAGKRDMLSWSYLRSEYYDEILGDDTAADVEVEVGLDIRKDYVLHLFHGVVPLNPKQLVDGAW